MTNAPRSEQTWSALDDDGGRTPEQRAAMLDMIMAYRLTGATLPVPARAGEHRRRAV